MESALLIEADNLSKCYHLWQRPVDRLLAATMEGVSRSRFCPDTLAQRLEARSQRLSRPFFALRDISFTLKAGESMGIIGRNGSGKSTLLQILAGTLTPTAGRVAARGRIAALLELGSGFNPEFTGRENVFLQAALAGFTRAAAQAHFEEVAEFAAIGEFIDQPVKVYSSGMMIRLAFATQTILRPDVFIVDEALAVGDIFFQAKCARFFQQRLAEGMSLLFVSHDLTSVKALCQRTLVLNEGRASFFGDSASAVSHFHHLHSSPGVRPEAEKEDSSLTGQSRYTGLPPGAVLRNWPPSQEIGTKEAEIIYCRVCDAAGAETRSFSVGERFSVEVFVRGVAPVANVQFAIELSDRHNRAVYGVSSVHLGLGYERIGPGETLSFRVSFEPRLGAGDYLVDVAVGLGDRGDGAPAQHVHRVAQIANVSIRHKGLKPGYFGPADLGAQIEVMRPSEADSTLERLGG